jgi:hypothetical protein
MSQQFEKQKTTKNNIYIYIYMTPSSPEPSHSALPELVQSPPEIPRDPFSPYQKIPNLQNRVPG